MDLDGAQWHIPKSKTGAAMDIPLAPVVVDWIRELRTLAGHSAYVLPAHSRSRAARHGGDSHLNKDTLCEAVAHWLRTAKPAVRRFTPHDLRSTVKSHLRALGVLRHLGDVPEPQAVGGGGDLRPAHVLRGEARGVGEVGGGAAGVDSHRLCLARLTG